MPAAVAALLAAPGLRQHIPTTDLALDAPPGTLQRALCATTRGGAGALRGAWARWRGSAGFQTHSGAGTVVALDMLPPGSLLSEQFADGTIDHEDMFSLTIATPSRWQGGSVDLLTALLEGFMENPPDGVTRMMALRNILVRPLGLRTSPLGCPVSSLLSPRGDNLFAQRFPVLAQRSNAAGNRSQVILGADDKHLAFRSCAGVEIRDDKKVTFTLGTRVRYKNLFGRCYMTLINRVHRGYVTPALLRLAVEHALQNILARAPQENRDHETTA